MADERMIHDLGFGRFLSHFASIFLFCLREINMRSIAKGGEGALFPYEVDFTIMLQIWTSSFRNKVTIFSPTGLTIINLVKK